MSQAFVFNLLLGREAFIFCRAISLTHKTFKNFLKIESNVDISFSWKNHPVFYLFSIAIQWFKKHGDQGFIVFLE